MNKVTDEDIRATFAAAVDYDFSLEEAACFVALSKATTENISEAEELVKKINASSEGNETNIAILSALMSIMAQITRKIAYARSVDFDLDYEAELAVLGKILPIRLMLTILEGQQDPIK